jgi:hypothetical protein
MENHYIDRMETEHKELCEKIVALKDFVSRNKIFETLDNQEKFRMIQQLGFMQSYAHILECRLHSAKSERI